MFSSYDHLLEFLVAAESLNLAEAAKKLHISPAAMSKHLASLEADLGCMLLKRDRHTFQLTSVGIAVYEAGQPLLDIGNAVEEAVRQNTPFRLLVLIDSSRIYRAIAQVVHALNQEGHKLNFTIENSSALRNVFSAVSDGVVDVAIFDSFSNPDLSDSVKVTELEGCFYQAVLRSTHPLASRDFLVVEDFVDWPLTRLTGNLQLVDHTWRMLREECLSVGFDPVMRERNILHPSEGALVDIEPDEVYILPESSQSLTPYLSNPDYRCLKIHNMKHRTLMVCLTSNEVAQEFCAMMYDAVNGPAED